MPEIAIKNLTKTFSDKLTALADVNLTIKNEEFVCILGQSGCGKSTLLEIIAGLQAPTSGSILLDDASVTGPSRDIGVVFQDSSLYPWRTVRENIELGLEIKGMKSAQRKELVDKYIKRVNLSGFESKYPHQLSGGMRQRVGLARTLANNPKVLLMDEPFGAVDHLTRLQLQSEVIDLWEKDKKTVVFITHDVSEAVYLGDRVIVFTQRPGRVKKIFDLPWKRQRNRNDSVILDIEERIYRALNYSDIENDPEYFL
jgi:ABC-type nitrate/sulfonate/bicarbonate transport system, ATPase component